jgi:hypothetical protein
MIDVVDTDGKSVLVENDDDERGAESYASYIEWTAPKAGGYYIMVKAFGRSEGVSRFQELEPRRMGGGGICVTAEKRKGSRDQDDRRCFVWPQLLRHSLPQWLRHRAGTFQLTITEAGSGGAQDTGDPCTGGATLRGTQGAPGVAVSFQPDGGTTDEAECSWVVSCTVRLLRLVAR